MLIKTVKNTFLNISKTSTIDSDTAVLIDGNVSRGISAIKYSLSDGSLLIFKYIIPIINAIIYTAPTTTIPSPPKITCVIKISIGSLAEHPTYGRKLAVCFLAFLEPILRVVSIAEVVHPTPIIKLKTLLPFIPRRSKP